MATARLFNARETSERFFALSLDSALEQGGDLLDVDLHTAKLQQRG